MNAVKTLIYGAVCLLALACVKENAQSSGKEKHRDPKVETMEVKVSASLDLQFKQAALAEDAEIAKLLAPTWEWAAGDSVKLIYSYDGVEGICISKSCTIDATDSTIAKFTFGGVPVAAKVVRLEIGSEGVFGQIVNESKGIGKNSVYEIATVSADAGTAEINDVQFVNCCSYFDVYVPVLRAGASEFQVNRIDLVGKSLTNGKNTEQTVSLDYKTNPRTNHYMFAVSNAAKDVRFDVTIQSGTSKLVDVDDMGGISKFLGIRDPADLSDVITVSVEAALDPNFKASTEVAYPEAAALCSWSATGDVKLSYSAGAFVGYDVPTSITVNPTDASKAILVFEQVPKKAKVTGLSYGSSDNFGAKAISGTMGEDFKCFEASIEGTAGSTEYTGVVLAGLGSYLRIDAKTVKIDSEDKTTTGITVTGATESAITFDDTEVQNVVWAYVSNLATNISVSATYDGGKASLKKLSDAGLGTAKVFAIDGENAAKETFATVLYTDGTLIINESGFDRDANVVKHGAISKTYSAWDGVSVKYDAPTGNPSDILWYGDCSAIKKVEFGSPIAPEYMRFWFYNHSSLTSIDVKNLDMSQCQTIKQCFYGCKNLTELNTSVWKNLSKLVNMEAAFYNCELLTAIDVKSWACTNVQVMKQSFDGCKALTELDFSTWNVGNSANFKDLTLTFNNTFKMRKLDCTGIHPVNVTILSKTFYFCGNSAGEEMTINISGWVTADLSGKAALQNTFSGCTWVTELDCSGFNTATCPDTQNCFRNCNRLVTIYASEAFTLPASCLSAGMFYGNTALVGGNGTHFDATKIDKTYARIDKSGQPGYFTKK